MINQHIPKSNEESDNNNLILKLYQSISKEDITSLSSCLSPELDWWYHGPPSHQHMKLLLTGITTCKTFHFMPNEVFLFGNRVFVEGFGRTINTSWVHIWTIHQNLCVMLREYFNTAIMVTNVTSSQKEHDVSYIWQSHLARIRDINIPGVVLAFEINTS